MPRSHVAVPQTSGETSRSRLRLLLSKYKWIFVVCASEVSLDDHTVVLDQEKVRLPRQNCGTELAGLTSGSYLYLICLFLEVLYSSSHPFPVFTLLLPEYHGRPQHHSAYFWTAAAPCRMASSIRQPQRSEEVAWTSVESSSSSQDQVR